MNLNSLACLQPWLRFLAHLTSDCTELCTWALVGPGDRVVIKCAAVLTWFFSSSCGRSNCIWTSPLYVPMQYISERQDGWGDFKGLLSFSCFHLQCEEFCKSCHKHCSCTSALLVLPTVRKKKKVFKSGALLPGFEPALAQGLLVLLLWDSFPSKIQGHVKNRGRLYHVVPMHLMCGTCPRMHPVAIQTCKVLFIVFIRGSYKRLSLGPACRACCPSWELIRQGNCTQDLSKSPAEPGNDFLLIQALELKQHRRSKLGKVSAFNRSEQYLNFPMLPLLFSFVGFFLDSELFGSDRFPLYISPCISKYSYWREGHGQEAEIKTKLW